MSFLSENEYEDEEDIKSFGFLSIPTLDNVIQYYDSIHQESDNDNDMENVNRDDDNVHNNNDNDDDEDDDDDDIESIIEDDNNVNTNININVDRTNNVVRTSDTSSSDYIDKILLERRKNKRKRKIVNINELQPSDQSSQNRKWQGNILRNNPPSPRKKRKKNQNRKEDNTSWLSQNENTTFNIN